MKREAHKTQGISANTAGRLDAMSTEERSQALAEARETIEYWRDYADHLECLFAREYPRKTAAQIESMNPIERAIIQMRPIRMPLDALFGAGPVKCAEKGE